MTRKIDRPDFRAGGVILPKKRKRRDGKAALSVRTGSAFFVFFCSPDGVWLQGVHKTLLAATRQTNKMFGYGSVRTGAWSGYGILPSYSDTQYVPNAKAQP